MKLYHYTVGQHYNNIVKDGLIKLATKYVPEGERPVVWLSSNLEWENSVRKTIRNDKGEAFEDMARDELFRLGITPVRIEIDQVGLELYDWEKFKNVSGMSPDLARSFEEITAKGWNYDSSEWYGSFEPIPVSSILSVEIWDGKNWVKHN